MAPPEDDPPQERDASISPQDASFSNSPSPVTDKAGEKPLVPSACGSNDDNDPADTPSSTQAIKKGQRNLTPAQLAKKRANDREAQRAIRKRTKHQIERLEARVRELELGDGYQELQKVLREKEALQDEVNEMRKRLEDIMEIVKPMVSAADWRSSNPQAGLKSEGDGLRRGARFWSTTTHPDFQKTDPQPSGVTPDQLKPATSTPLGSLTSSYATSTSRPDFHSNTLASGPSGQQLEPLQPSPADDTFYKPATSWFRPFDPITSSQTAKTRLPYRPPTPSLGFSQLPMNILPTCLFDTILNDFATHTRDRAASEQSLREILGPPQPDFSPLMDPKKRSVDDSSALLNLLIDLLKGFSALSGWPEKIAIISNMFFVMRWIICPTPDNFDLIPEAMKPLDIQIKLAHPIWVDYIPWRRMRQKMVYDYVRVPLDSFFMPYTTTLSLNWWSDDLTSCVYYDSLARKTLIRPEFENHKNDENNWTLGKHFEEVLPMLANTCNIKEKVR